MVTDKELFYRQFELNYKLYSKKMLTKSQLFLAQEKLILNNTKNLNFFELIPFSAILFFIKLNIKLYGIK